MNNLTMIKIMSIKQMIGDTRIQGPMTEGASQIRPEGWLIELNAMGTRPQKTDSQRTGSSEGDVTLDVVFMLNFSKV